MLSVSVKIATFRLRSLNWSPVASSNFGFVASGISWSSKIFSGIFSDEGRLKCEGLNRNCRGDLYNDTQWPVARICRCGQKKNGHFEWLQSKERPKGGTQATKRLWAHHRLYFTFRIDISLERWCLLRESFFLILKNSITGLSNSTPLSHH